MNLRMKFPMVINGMCKRLIVFFLVSFSTLFVFANDNLPVAKQLVTDQSGVLQADQLQQLERKLEAYNDSTSTQIAIVIQETTNGRDPYDYAMEIAKSWGIGQKGKNNGVLIFIASTDRKIRILTGRGIEDRLPDAICKRIINRLLKPSLKVGDYYGGLNAATDEMMARASGAFVNDSDPADGDGIPFVFIFVIVFFIISIIGKIINRNNRGGGNNSRGGGGMFFPPIFLGGGRNWDSGNGGWGSGGGGFGGFGGGSFGGGGAGGDF
ncbi:MAG: hypothetical protein RJA76_664 [Bacteroidota bacterium]